MSIHTNQTHPTSARGAAHANLWTTRHTGGNSVETPRLAVDGAVNYSGVVHEAPARCRSWLCAKLRGKVIGVSRMGVSHSGTFSDREDHRRPTASRGHNVTTEDSASDTSDDYLEYGYMRSMLHDLAEMHILEGKIDPRGKTDEQVLHESHLCLTRRESRLFTDMDVSVSHLETLLNEARRFVDIGKPMLATVMYATWVEHKLNWVLMYIAYERNSEKFEDAKRLVHADFKTKTGPLWVEVAGTELGPDLVAAMRELARRRNDFLHYKWPRWIAADPDVLADEETAWMREDVAPLGETVVAELHEWYCVNMLMGWMRPAP